MVRAELDIANQGEVSDGLGYLESWAQKSPQLQCELSPIFPQVYENYGAGGGIRTRDLGIMRPSLCH
jgi:hypothetical protein